jgi:CBS domain-containing protein
MKLRDIIKSKGFEVIAVDCETPVANAIKKMVDRNIGSLLIVSDGSTAGMFTERDVLKCWANGLEFESTPIKDVMTKDIVVADIEESVSYAASIMTQKRVRHLPVLEKGKLVSVLSMRDVVRAEVKSLEEEVHYLKDFITDAV